MLVEEVPDARGDSKAVGKVIAGGHIKAGVASIVGRLEREKVDVGANPAEVTDEIPVHTRPENVEDDGPRVFGAAKKRFARTVGRIGGRVIGSENTRGVIGVIAIDAEPFFHAQFAGQIESTRASQIGVEICAAVIGIWLRIGSVADDVREAAGEKANRDTSSVGKKILVERGIVCFALFGLEIWISGITRVRAIRLFECGFLDAFAIGETEVCVAPNTIAVTGSVNDARAGDGANPEGGVGYDAEACRQRDAAYGEPTAIGESGLIVAAGVCTSDDAARISVFDLIFIPERDEALCEGVVGLLVEGGDVVLIDEGRPVAGDVIGINNARIPSREAMLPVIASLERPSQIRGEILVCIILAESGRFESVGPGIAAQLELLRTVRRSWSVSEKL